MPKQKMLYSSILITITFMTVIVFVSTARSEEPYPTLVPPAFVLPKAYDTSKMYDSIELTKSDMTVAFMDEQILNESSLYFIGGRVYLPLEESVLAAGGRVVDEGDAFAIEIGDVKKNLSKTEEDFGIQHIYFVNGMAYVGLLHFTEIMGLSAVFHTTENKLDLYRAMMLTDVSNETVSSQQKAYIRFEDIAANSEAYNKDETLTKYRFMADYMAQHGQGFYISWIPLFVNPPQGIENDLTRNVNLYNASFLYTLDYLVKRGGHIVVHGLTHQTQSEISGLGVEFGKDVPFTGKEREERIIRVKAMVAALGFDNSIFEFPHYSATYRDLRLSEKYFDIIFQSHPSALEKIKKVRRSSIRCVIYIPAPVGYVESNSSVDDTLAKISSTYRKGIVVSLFFHPWMDMNQLVYRVENGVLVWTYDDNAILPRLVGRLRELGLAFSAYDVS